jgi:hypothetical protein
LCLYSYVLFLSALGAFATNQELAEKIKLSILIAPIHTVKYVKGSGRLPAYFTPTAFKVCDEVKVVVYLHFSKQVC